MVIDQTTYDLDPLVRAKENFEFHASYQGTDKNAVDPKWIYRIESQSILFAQLFHEKILPLNINAVDYGCGDGKLSEYFLNKYWELEHSNESMRGLPEIKRYDKFMNKNSDYLSDYDMKQKSFDMVITCSVFEHLIGKENVEEIMGLLNEHGIFCLHTLVCEEVPNDPDWYYLLPVHCTIWTNKAMEILYKQYNFKGCAYNVEARRWFMFKENELFLRLKSNSSKVSGTWVFSEHFVDYWKQKPYKVEKNNL